QTVTFPLLNNQAGRIISSRSGKNPAIGEFMVIDVEMAGGDIRSFAAELEDHKLNIPPIVGLENTNEPDEILKSFQGTLETILETGLADNPDLVRIADRWFPKALLVDVNIGHLNLVEALLEMENGGPLPTKKIIDQIELPTDVNLRLTEFSLNHALQNDGRFDEVGPSGEVLWFLRRLEPPEVRETPIYLRKSSYPEYDAAYNETHLSLFDEHIIDELQPELMGRLKDGAVVIALTYPHWRSGTLPISGYLTNLFPSAYESPRVLFTFFDTENNDRFSGWVVRQSKYVFGLHEWYKLHDIIPGSLIALEKSEKSGEILIKIQKRRSSKEYVKTALVGADGGIVFANLKQMVSCEFDERLALVTPDVDSIDAIWQSSAKQRGTIEKSILAMMRELAKLTPQGHVHAQELYSAVNLVRRCPPGPILSLLLENDQVSDLGNLYFRLEDKAKGDEND
ncbi:MAG: hypothetical protein HPY76_04695, partial [Anaerolineae bacterium]|nr:hypothetical protein [Anaerolineae bacterium]